jgi:hypothetical protein
MKFYKTGADLAEDMKIDANVLNKTFSDYTHFANTSI